MAALAFLRHWKLIGLGLVCLLLAVQTVRLGHRSNQLERAKIDLNECREGRKQDREAYIQAQRDAKAKNEARVRSTEQQYKDANDAQKRDLTARLERLRSELRNERHSAPQGNPGQPGSPEDRSGPGTPQATGLCLTPEEHVRAAENEEYHDQLISLVKKLMGIDPNATTPDTHR